MIRAILYHERLGFLLRAPAAVAALLIVSAIGYAGWSGDTWRDAKIESQHAFESEKLASLARWREQLVDVEAGRTDPTPRVANPMSVSFPATLPPSTLADFAIGHANLHPSIADLSLWNNLSSVFGQYQFDNPTTLASSPFDIAMVVVVLMPILMLAVSFDVLAGERASGSLAMVLASPIRLTKLVWTRLAVRNGLLWLVAVGAMLMLAALNDTGGDRFDRFWIWVAVSLTYGLVWFSVIAFCVARFRSAIATAGSLVGLWLLFTLGLPAVFSSLSDAIYPTPSRLGFLSEIREAQSETNQNLAELTEGFLLDHPDLTVGEDNVPAFFRGAFLSNEAARRNTQPIVDGYEQARAGREQTIRWLQFLSPSIIAHRLLAEAAGADLDRQHRFQAQVQTALMGLSEKVGPAVVSRNRLSLDEFDQLEPFQFEDISPQDLARRAAGPLAFMLALALLIGIAAHRRLARG